MGCTSGMFEIMSSLLNLVLCHLAEHFIICVVYISLDAWVELNMP